MTSTTTLERTAADRVRKSQALRERAMKVLARGHQGHRNPHDTLALGGPGYASRSLGSRIWDVDGNEYIDYVMSFGPIVLGHADPEFNEAITRRIARGTVTSIQEADEVELAEALVERVPSAEMASLFIGGSSACLAALRYARASTGKTMAIKCGYHGWLDWSGAGGEGIPSRVSDLTIEVKYNDLEAIEAAFEAHPSDIAAVFIESVQDDGPREGYFDAVRDIAHRHGAVFVVDEVKTGFRYAIGGAQEYYGIEPDLSVFAKALSNGYPGSAVVGRREIFESADARMGATFHGDGLSIAAALETIRRLERDDGIAHLWRIGERLKEGLSEVFDASGGWMTVKGDPPMLRVQPAELEDPRGAAFFAGMHLRGVYMIRGVCFASLAHTESDVDQTIEAAGGTVASADA
ncbi:MAG: aminotransferase class III-fold pyridoxal phosphate-dependent enzyme [Chloroflexi bacterium]|nr:aminotransferase class III-fold pyridoxal phosphate-dependent enzyme [Chloroflexota bacterium]MCY3938404.1 aminotransferase class III-fold pyridoxal phosphate-dependent enzyme [Chloroflexota bacterium]